MSELDAQLWRPMSEAPEGEVIFCRDAELWMQPMIVHSVAGRYVRRRWPWSKEKYVPGYRTYAFALPTDDGVCYALSMRADRAWTPVEWCWPFFEAAAAIRGERE